jgi:hypothetical protein
MRSLLVVPILHTAADLGSLAESVRGHYLAKYGPAAWAQRERTVAAIWADVRKRLAAMTPDCAKLRVYQDGLPVCGQELKIVEELAAAGSVNHQIVLDLVRQGATLVGTEDPRLLIAEYQMHRRQLDPAKAAEHGREDEARVPCPRPRGHVGEPGHEDEAVPPALTPPGADAAKLLDARDRFIARRIGETLPQGHTGLLFLGAAHRIDPHLASDIEVRSLG